MQSGGGPLQPGPSVMRGLASGTSGSSQQQPDMQKMQSQPLMNQQYQQPNIFRSAGTNQATRQTRPMVPYHHPHLFTPLFPVQYNRLPNQWANYGSMPGMSYPHQYYMQPAHILPAQHQQNRRNATGENNLVNVNSNFSAAPTNGVTNLNPLTPIPQIQQVQLQQPQPNQQSSPMSHELLVMQQLHPPQPQQTPQQVTGGGQAPMDQHQPNPAQVNVGGPQPPHTMTSPIGVVPFIPPGPPSKVNKKKQRGSRAIPIINPDTQEDVLEKIFNDSTPPTVPTVISVPSSTGQQSQQQQSSIAVATAPTSTYNPLPPNVPPHVPLNPAVVEPEYENYSPHPHPAASDLGGMMHHQPPPHMHHPPPPPNHPPPHVHPGAAHPGAAGTGGPGLLQHDMGRSPQPIVNSQQSHSELVYTGPIKIVNPPPHLPQQHHPSAVAATAEMTPGGTPVVSAIADGPSVEIKPYQKKKKPTNEGLILQQPPPPQHPMDAVKALSMSNQQQQQQHHMHQQQQQHMGLVEPVPIMYPQTERFRTVSEKSIAESTLSTDAEPFVYTRPSSTNSSSNNHQHHHQQQQQQQHRMPPPPACTLVVHEKQQSQSSMVTPEMVVPAFVPTVVAPVPVVVPAEKQQQQPQPPQETVSLKPEMEVEANKHLDTLVTCVDKLSLEENNNNNSNSSSSSSNSAGLNQLPVGGAHGGKKNKQGKQQQQQKRVEEVASVASETSNLVGVVSSSSKAPVTETVIEMKEQQHQSQQMAVEPVDETDRSAVSTDAPQQQSASSSLISNLVEHKPSKLDNDNIINNNIVDCTSTTIISTDNTTDNNQASSPMENAIQHQQQQQKQSLDSRQHTPPTATATQLLDVENNIQQQQQPQPEFDDNENVVPTGGGALLESISAPLSKQTTPEPAGQTTDSNAPQALIDTTAASGAITTTAAPVLPARKSRSLTLIEYDPDQWSPENPSGKKKYSRDQLLLLKNAAPAREKPINLPNSLEYVLIKTSHGGNPSMGGGGGPYGKNNFNNEMSLLPTFVNRMVGGGGGGGGGAMGQMRQPYPGKRPSQQGNNNQSGMQSNKQSQQGMSKTGSKIIRVQLDEEVKLKECANAWRPRVLQGSDTTVEGQDRPTTELFKKFRSILNKLTPDNFDKLVQQVKEYVINTDEQLDGCIKLVFEKAVSEPNFSEAYAKMCTEIGTIAIDTHLKHTSFRTRLLTQCQNEFERRRNDQTSAMMAGRAKLEASKDMSKEEFEELKLQLEEEEQKVRRRAVGTVRFIGELFKHGQLTNKIMHSCINMLLFGDYNEETLECLCKLLTTIGLKMEKEGRQDLNKYFEKIESIVKNPSAYKISSRIRFMMQDVIDLRRIGWQPRRTDLNPKTMNQIQKEAETEQLQININYMARTKDSGGPYPGDMGRTGNKPMQGSGGGSGPKMGGSGPMGPPGGYNQGSLGRGGSQGSMKGGRLMTDDDGFRHISSNRNNRSLTIDPKKIAFPGSVDVTQARLGVPSMYQDWKNNSNMFAALNNEEANQGGAGRAGGSSMMDRDRDSDRDRSGSHRDRDRNQRDRDRSGSHNKNSGGKDSYHHNKGSMERERYNRYGSSNSQNDDRMSRSSREPSSGSGMRPMSGQHSNSQMHDRDRERERDRDRASMGGSKMPMQQQPPMGGRLSQQRHLQQSSGGPAMPSAASPPTSAAGSMGPPPPSGNNNAMLCKSGSGQMYQQQQLPQFAIPKDAVRSFPEPDKDTRDKIEHFSKQLHMENDDIGLQESMILFTALEREFYHAAISQLLFDNIERDSASREAVVKAIAMMFDEKHINKADYLHALEEVFNMAEDLIIDLPQLYRYIATFYVLLLHKRCINLADILSVSQEIISTYGKLLLTELLLQYEHSYGQDATFMLWHESSLSFTDFIQLGSLEAVDRYLTDSKLGYLLDSGGKALDMQTVAKQIKDSLASSPNNSDIFKWITKYIGPQRVTSKEFIRTLTRAVMEHCIDNETKLNPVEFQKWHPILQKYIDNKAERELQAMYAIQRLVVELEHPQNLLSTIVQQLYDCDVINEGFGLWKDSEDPLEAEGKGVCLKGIKQFVTMYMENSSDEDN